jgi:alkanesulfonate monooxygenase SsuD/methylene tetrahydromethanopterin reductase-like flavin-dependent oxidoreductase (luciferase family)
MTRIGMKGWLPTSSGFLHPNWLKNHWRNYSNGCASESRVPVCANWRIARSIFVANDDKVAEAYGRRDNHSPYRFHMKQLSTKLAKSPAGLRGFKADESMRDEDVTLDYIMDNIVIAGSPNSVVDQILAMQEKTGDFGTLLCVGTDWTDKGLARTSMTLMAEKVMPAVNAALPPQTARRAAAGQQAS